MEAFKLGDDRSFDILYDKHFKPLFIFQQRNMCWISREDAEDLTDEAFLAVIRAKDRFDVHRAFKPWLFKIAYNIKVTFLRRTKAAPQIVVEPFGRDPRRTLILESCAESAPAPDLVLQIIEALTGLPSEHRSVIELKFFHGFESSEIAEILNIAPGTVWSRIHYGLEKLRGHLKSLPQPLRRDICAAREGQ